DVAGHAAALELRAADELRASANADLVVQLVQRQHIDRHAREAYAAVRRRRRVVDVVADGGLQGDLVAEAEFAAAIQLHQAAGLDVFTRAVGERHRDQRV